MASEAHWHEYPVSRPGEVSLAFTKTTVSFGIGLAAAFALLLAIGLPADEGFLGALLADLGARPDTIRQLVDGIDFVMRVSAGVLLALVLLALLGGSIASATADDAVGETLDAAAAEGAAREEAPAPQQVERVARDHAQGLDILLWSLVGAGGFILGYLLIFSIVERFWDGLIVAVIGLAAVAGMLWLVLARRGTRERQRERRRRIAAHWTTEDEAAAWRTARETGEGYRKKKGSRDRHRLVRIGIGIDRVAAGAIVLVPSVFMVSMFTMYPNARRISPSQWETGERAELTGAAEQFASWGIWRLSALLLVAVILPVVGLIMQGRGYAVERRDLIAALGDPEAPRPDRGVLQHHSERQPAASAQLLAGFAGVGLAFGPAVFILSLIRSEGFYEGADALVAPYRWPAFAMAIVAIMLLLAAFLVNARTGAEGRELRNRLMRRWPTLPIPKTTKEGEREVPVRATVGPALTPGANRDVSQAPVEEWETEETQEEAHP